MSRSSKRKNSASRNHTTKTKAEQDAYQQKVKLSESEGSTRDSIYPKTSTLSERSMYCGQSSTGISDRDQITPPRLDEKSSSEQIEFWAKILGVVVIFAGVIVYVTTIKNTCDNNKDEITKIETSVKEIDQRREELQARIIKLEQWDQSYSKEIQELKNDLKQKVSVDYLERRLSELEKSINKDKAKD